MSHCQPNQRTVPIVLWRSCTNVLWQGTHQSGYHRFFLTGKIKILRKIMVYGQILYIFVIPFLLFSFRFLNK